ncbi:MAG TPA: CDP-archaeol synthase [Candidatus Saccharimonadales bacterium]|nr:CDP-archaeol synthase [Candidatus Saccharimonadales bacterium]
MLKELLFAIWFFMPAAFANAAPVFVAKIPRLKDLNAPMDFGRSYKSQRVFGSHKTWRGFIAGVIVATLVFWLQQVLVRHYTWAYDLTSQVDYGGLPTLILGPLFGIGALGGDAIESFFKRQRHVAPGHGWFPFDQTDYIIGGALLTAPFVPLSFREYVLLILFWLLAHIAASYVGYLIGLKERPI